MSDLYSMLAGTTGNEVDYLAKDPWYMAGRNLQATQLPRPKTNWEALLMPALTGFASGSMMGYGEQSANQAAYTDARANPLLAALSPRMDALGGAAGPLTQEQSMLPDYSSALAPDNWTPKQAKSDLIMALIGHQNQAEQELKAQEWRQKLAESLDPEIMVAKARQAGMNKAAEVGAENGAMPGALGVLAGIPKDLRDNAVTEAATLDTKDRAVKVLDNAFDSASQVGTVAAMIPRSDAKIKFDAAKSQIITAVTALWKGVMSEKDRQSIEGLLPSPWDTTDQIKIKKKGLGEVIAAQQGESPLAHALRDNLGQGKSPTPPPGYELTGKVDANGNYGIRKAQ